MSGTGKWWMASEYFERDDEFIGMSQADRHLNTDGQFIGPETTNRHIAVFESTDKAVLAASRAKRREGAFISVSHAPDDLIRKAHEARARKHLDQLDAVLAALLVALPYVEDGLDDADLNKSVVRGHVTKVRDAIALVSRDERETLWRHLLDELAAHEHAGEV